MTSSLTPAALPTQRRSSWPIRITLGVIGLFTMTPALALVSPDQLAIYGVESPNAVVTTLLQHRGALQLALGAALVWAGVDHRVRIPILLAATFTKGVGVVLTLTRPEVFAASSGNIGLWFDIGCIVVLPAVAVHTVISLRRGAHDERPRAGAACTGCAAGSLPRSPSALGARPAVRRRAGRTPRRPRHLMPPCLAGAGIGAAATRLGAA